MSRSSLCPLYATPRLGYTGAEMTKDSIITLPNPHLRQKAQKIGVITPAVKALIKDMETATLDWEDSREHEVGVALAANQVDRLQRIIVVRNNFEDRSDRSFTAFINPEIIKFEGEISEDFEGCLSVPDFYGKVPRYNRVKVKALDTYGRQVRLTVEGFLARIFQHEIDHTHGVLFIDHIKDTPDAFYKLQPDGQLEPLNYEEHVQTNHLLW